MMNRPLNKNYKKRLPHEHGLRTRPGTQGGKNPVHHQENLHSGHHVVRGNANKPTWETI